MFLSEFTTLERGNEKSASRLKIRHVSEDSGHKITGEKKQAVRAKKMNEHDGGVPHGTIWGS